MDRSLGLKLGDKLRIHCEFGVLSQGKDTIRGGFANATIVGFSVDGYPMAYVDPSETVYACGGRRYTDFIAPEYKDKVDTTINSFWFLFNEDAFERISDQQPKKAQRTMSNPFTVGDLVSKKVGTDKLDGVVKYVTCYGATHAGGKMCSHRHCPHTNIKDYIWVEWPDGRLFSYKHNELLTAEDKMLSIQRERETERATMSEKPSFMDQTKKEAVDAMYRVASKQMTKGVKNGILALLSKQGQSSDRLAAISEFLDTEIGSALISYGLGLGLQHAPMLSNDPRALKLASEFRTEGFATVGNQVIGMAMEHILPSITGALSALPKEEATIKTRVLDAPSTSEQEEKEEAPLEEVLKHTEQARVAKA